MLTGEPSQEIVKLSIVRDAHLIVMGRHSSGLLGPRMGSVAYRVRCLAGAIVLALPPVPAAAQTPAYAAQTVGRAYVSSSILASALRLNDDPGIFRSTAESFAAIRPAPPYVDRSRPSSRDGGAVRRLLG